MFFEDTTTNDNDPVILSCEFVKEIVNDMHDIRSDNWIDILVDIKDTFRLIFPHL